MDGILAFAMAQDEIRDEKERAEKLGNAKRKELLKAPMFTGKENLSVCQELWIMPTSMIHDSGFNCMIIVVGYIENGERKKVRCEGTIDHLWGMNWHAKGTESFSIDCDGGVIHLYHYGNSFKVNWMGTSTFEINPN